MEINSNNNVKPQKLEQGRVKPIELNVQNPQNSKQVKGPESSNQDTVAISKEAQALFNEGGSHPKRPD